MPTAFVIGLGKSGIAAARLLQQQGYQVTVSDRQSNDALQSQQQALEQAGITVKLGNTFEPTSLMPSERPELIVVSPGVPWDSPALVAARALGIETIGEMELAWRHLQTCPWVGITGTNGKTTTTALIAAIFQAAGLNAPACGNIGLAACELALSPAQVATDRSADEAARCQDASPPLPSAFDWIIAEVSSYQIEASPTLAPRIGVWTTFTPDHLSRHGTLANYYRIKAQLVQRSHHQVFNGDDPYLVQQANQWPNAWWTSTQGPQPDNGLAPQVYIDQGWVLAQGTPIVPMTALRMPGAHNQQNLLMAVAVAVLAGLDKAAIADAVSHFPGVPHRLEWICNWQGIDFINDSKATNYDAALVGVTAIPAPVILIAGGEPKQGEDDAWLQAIRARATKVLLIGEAAIPFAQRLDQVGYGDYEIVETLTQAVPRAAELAQTLNVSKVLFSPACASFDQYQNFEQRGDHFRHLCQALGE
ncbi:UDP-N-acetylmuramoyl-L-alanine--D-glutamate ligase [Trichothermofontia sp.]